ECTACGYVFDTCVDEVEGDVHPVLSREVRDAARTRLRDEQRTHLIASGYRLQNFDGRSRP
ncbi:unnamed protein product, partial [marine sediment metagenome]